MITKLIEKIQRENMRKTALPKFEIGDSVKVSVKIKEGEKERIQIFSGIVIARKGGGSTETFTVRKISHGVGVERIFPLNSPHVVAVDIESSGHVRRAKLYFLRERVGKKAKLEERAMAAGAVVASPVAAT